MSAATVVNVGGKEPDGKPSAIGRWTFATKKVRDELLPHVRGDVLNAFAGKTKLGVNGAKIVRNDINPERDADLHVDAATLDTEFDECSFDVVILDPPFDQTQSDEHYDGLHARDMGDVRKAVAPLVRPGGEIVEFGWSMWGAADYFDGWTRDRRVVFRRGIPDRQPVFMTVDRNAQRRLIE